jgi:hypothetical protein
MLTSEELHVDVNIRRAACEASSAMRKFGINSEFPSGWRVTTEKFDLFRRTSGDN